MIGLCLFSLISCRNSTSDDKTSAPPAPKPDEPQIPWFTDIAAAVGLTFEHTTCSTGEYWFPEIAGSGCALFDYDNDGDLDAYLIQTSPIEGPPDPALTNRLFRNDLIDAQGKRSELHFTDVTESAGVGDTGYGMGCAVGDIDNDGDLDLYVTNYGPNVLYRNNGDGTFANASDSIPDESRWSTSAAFLDYDRDGWLDLFITNYVDASQNENKICHGSAGARDYCGPQSYDVVSDRLFRNQGDGTYRDATTDAGVHLTFGAGLGVETSDFNRDGWPDVYVANDGGANQLWINRANPNDPGFDERGIVYGAAYNAQGEPEAGMGVTAGDFDVDGDEDIFLSHLAGETNTLLVNDGRARFEDLTGLIGLGTPSRRMTGFGTKWVDLDLDGALDLFIANGAVKREASQAGSPFPYGVPNQVFRNAGKPSYTFEDVSARAGDVMQLAEVSRGAAFGDVDEDGDVDVLVSNANGPVRLFRNDIGNDASWLKLRLIGSQGRDAFNAIVSLVRDERIVAMDTVRTCGSYCSANDPRITFGLDDSDAAQTIIVEWPGGSVERFTALDVRAVHALHEGEGEIISAEYVQQLRSGFGVQIDAIAAAPVDHDQPGGVTQIDSDDLPPIPYDEMEPAVRRQFEAAERAIRGDAYGPDAIGRLGMLLMAYEQPARAAPYLQQAESLDPVEPKWPYLLGVVLADTGDPLAAITKHERVLTLEPNNVANLLRLTDLLRETGSLDRAIELGERALKTGESTSYAHYALGSAYFLKGDLASADRHLTAAVRASPEVGGMHYAFARLRSAQQRDEEAERHFALAEQHRLREAIFDDPRRLELALMRTGAVEVMNRGIVIMRLRQSLEGVERAIKLFEEAIRIDPSLAEAHAQLGSALLVASRPAEAERALRSALDLDPTAADPAYNLALLVRNYGDLQGAVELFQRAIESRPQHAPAQLGLGVVLRSLDRGEEAVEHLRIAVDLRPTDARGYKHLASQLEDLGRFAEAVEVLRLGTEAVEMEQSIPQRLAWILATCPDAAVRDPEQALTIAQSVSDLIPHPQHPLVPDTLAAALAANGRFEEARQAAIRARNLALERGDGVLTLEIENHIKLYEAGRKPHELLETP